MTFTDRYIKVPTIVYNNKQQELFNKESHECEQLGTFRMINPMRIESYEPAMPAEAGFGLDAQIATSIIMYSGESLMTYLTINEFEKLFNEHHNNQ